MAITLQNTADLQSVEQPATVQATMVNVSKRKSLLLLLALLIAIIFLSLGLGRYYVPIKDVFLILLSNIFPIEETWTSQMETVVINMRMPRILLACFVGGSLSVAGVCYQSVFKNPLSSPDILGASSGAAFGAALGLLLGFSSSSVALVAFFFSIFTLLLVFKIASKAPGIHTVNLILAGMVVSSLFTAGTSYIKLVADPYSQLPSITYWLMGSLSGASMSSLYGTLLPMSITLLLIFLLKWRINILTLSDEEAYSLGINIKHLRFCIIGLATVLTACAVSVAGMIGWVGLIVPHICRKVFGSSHEILIPSTFISGALFLLIVDNISRNLLAVEIPIGILTALLGAPCFIYLICRKEQS